MELKKIIIELKKHLTQQQIAKAAGSSQAAISRIMAGGDTYYTIGKRLEMLALQYNIFAVRDDKHNPGENP